MYNLLRSLLFLLPAETAHYFTLSIFKIVTKIPFANTIIRSAYSPKEKTPLKFFGLNFKNPVGLAAGFDKNAKYLHQLALLGFGFIEIGTVTPLPQTGNPKPRLFRLIKDKALINRMGFNNVGVDRIVERLKTRPKDLIVGGNIGKNKITPNENAVDDYVICFQKLFDHVDYFAVNVSSPNTPGLRNLQEKGPLTKILNALQDLNINGWRGRQPQPKPVFLKISPDLSETQLDEIIEIVRATKIAGIIATNTTISRENLLTDKSEIEKTGDGGLSGKPVYEKTLSVIRYLKMKNPELFIIAVGGIFSSADAKQMMDAGASLVQVYTGFIYEGPGIVKRILNSEF